MQEVNYSSYITLSSNFWEKMRINVVNQLFADFKKANDLVRREVLYNILIEFGIPMNLVRLIKMWVRVGKSLSGVFPMKNGLKESDAV